MQFGKGRSHCVRRRVWSYDVVRGRSNRTRHLHVQSIGGIQATRDVVRRRTRRRTSLRIRRRTTSNAA